MYNDILHQAILFFVFFVVGIVCAFIYDTFRVSERFARSGLLLSIIKDILFWVIITILMFIICLRFNNGVIRFYMLLGIFAGSITYFNTISRYVLNILFFIINFVKKIILLLLNIMLVPLRFFLKLINKPVFLALSFSRRSIADFCKKIKFKFIVLKKFRRWYVYAVKSRFLFRLFLLLQLCYIFKNIFTN